MGTWHHSSYRAREPKGKLVEIRWEPSMGPGTKKHTHKRTRCGRREEHLPFQVEIFQMAVWVNHLPLTVEFTLNVTYSDELPARTLCLMPSWARVEKKIQKKRACFVSCSIKSNLPSNNWGTFCKPYALEAFSRRTFPRDYSFVDIRSLEK